MTRLSRNTGILSIFLAAILSAPGFAATPYAAQRDAHVALPGTLNYVEGQATMGDDQLNADSIGSATLANGETLQTDNGKAEILLTPGVFLRVGDNSAVQMVSNSLTNTEVQLNHGRAMVEVAELHDQNNLRISEDGVETKLVKKGLYAFDADSHQVLVFDGKANVQDSDRTVEVKGGKALDLNSDGKLKPQSFNKDDYKQSDLYQWSSLRSSYLAEANVDAAQVYVNNGYYGPGWIGPGWYWAPGFGGYTFIPGDGILSSPFGWRYYSPLVVYRAPAFYGYRHFYPGPVIVNRVNPGYRGPLVRTVPAPVPAPRVPAVRPPAFHPAPSAHGGFTHGTAPAVHGGFGHGGFGGHAGVMRR